MLILPATVAAVATLVSLVAVRALADDIGCLSRTFRILGANNKVCDRAFDDPKLPGVACHISQAHTGGVKGSLGLAEDPARFSIACRQVGPVAADIAKAAHAGVLRRWLDALQQQAAAIP
jgi:CreA protein